MIRNDYYGGESASLNLTQLWSKFRGNDKPPMFKAVDGSYVFNKGKIHKVPATDVVALKSPLMGLFEFDLGDASYLRYMGLQVAWNVSTE